jgi:hypothetical protein
MTSAYTINLNPNITTPVKTGYTFKAGDKGITFNIVVNEMDNATGMTAKICFMRANGASVEATLTGTGPTFSYTTLGNEFAVPGVVVADVKFYNSTTQRYSTASFVFNVIGDTLDGIGAGTGGYSDQLETLSAEFSDTLHEYQDAFGLVGAIIPRGVYSATTHYSALDLVSYSGSSWLCREGCTGVTPSAGQYWQLFASGNDYASLTNKPSINGVTLAAGQTGESLGLVNSAIQTVSITTPDNVVWRSSDQPIKRQGKVIYFNGNFEINTTGDAVQICTLGNSVSFGYILAYDLTTSSVVRGSANGTSVVLNGITASGHKYILDALLFMA